MKYRQLGTSELQVPVISLGSWLTYSGGVEKRQAIACVHKALDLGINFFDTANVVWARRRRDGVGERCPAGRATPTSSRPKSVARCRRPGGSRAVAARRSPSRSTPRSHVYRTDYVDLYQGHRYDADIPLEDTMGALPAGRRLTARPAISASASGPSSKISGGDRDRRSRPVRLLPAAVLDAVAGARDVRSSRVCAELASHRSSGRRSPRGADRQVPRRTRRRRRDPGPPMDPWAPCCRNAGCKPPCFRPYSR